MENNNKNFKKEVGRRFRAVRNALKKTLKEIAVTVGKDWSSVASIESGKSFPSVQILHELYRVYGINSNWIISGVGEIFSDDASKSKTIEGDIQEFLYKHGDHLSHIEKTNFEELIIEALDKTMLHALSAQIDIIKNLQYKPYYGGKKEKKISQA